MRVSVGLGKDGAEERLAKRGVSRRDFMKFCTAVAVAMGMGPAFAPKVAEALTSGARPSVVYLHLAECTGCSEAVLRTMDPYIDALILDTISLDYHETLMAGAGDAVERALEHAIEGEFVCVVEGGVPMIEDGAWGKVSGKTMLSIIEHVVPKAAATICMGTCASYGGVQKAAPNPSQAVSVSEALGGITTVNIPGCPPNPINFVGAVVYYLTNNGGIPPLDSYNRPELFYGEAVHDNCPRLEKFENGEFATSFASEEAKNGACLYELGCKGPDTFNNCPKVLFNDTTFPIIAGHPCIGCSEPDFWDNMSPFYEM